MKRLFFVSLLCSLFLCSCNQNDVELAIVGHTFESTVRANESWYFATNNTARLSYYEDGSIQYVSNFTYKITGTLVEIYCDYSSMWKETARGAFFGSFTYNPEDRTLYSSDWGLYKLKY